MSPWGTEHSWGAKSRQADLVPPYACLVSAPGVPDGAHRGGQGPPADADADAATAIFGLVALGCDPPVSRAPC